MKPTSYSEAGVDTERGDKFAGFISSFPSSAVAKTIGGFAGGVPLPTEGYRKPLLLGATDGVGTKLLVAKHLGDYSTVGIDLVAMCVNDLAVCGADPLFFLDYIACGELNETRLKEVIGGVVRGCELAGCALTGGETAEMPDMYAPDDLDLAGFSVGLVDEDEQLPRLSLIEEGDVVLGLPSSGIHSNGFSLARKALASADDTVWKELLTPTTIYVDELKKIRHLIRAAAHITGGGLRGNLIRVVPTTLTLHLDWNWNVPGIFDRIARDGGIEQEEMRRVFNMGIGMALVAPSSSVDEISRALDSPFLQIGRIVRG